MQECERYGIHPDTSQGRLFYILREDHRIKYRIDYLISGFGILCTEPYMETIKKVAKKEDSRFHVSCVDKDIILFTEEQRETQALIGIITQASVDIAIYEAGFSLPKERILKAVREWPNIVIKLHRGDKVAKPIIALVLKVIERHYINKNRKLFLKAGALRKLYEV